MKAYLSGRADARTIEAEYYADLGRRKILI